VGALVASSEHCLTVVEAADELGLSASLQLKGCEDVEAQRFTRDEAAHFHWAHRMDRSLEVNNGETNSDAVLVLANEANPATQRQWEFRGARLVGRSGLCLEPQWATGRVEVAHCEASAFQLWDVTAYNEIVGSGYCLDVPSSLAVEGAGVQVYPCHQGPNQQFRLDGNRIVYEGLCFNVPGAAPGSVVELLSCRERNDADADTQGFYLRGQVVSEDRCLSARGDGLVQLATCDGSAPQIWTWHF
jgi:hypothetical protein